MQSANINKTVYFIITLLLNKKAYTSSLNNIGFSLEASRKFAENFETAKKILLLSME